MAGGHRIRIDMRVQGMTAWTMLVCNFKVILPGPGFPLCGTGTAGLLALLP
jgi:hypothetical protein